MWYCKGIFGSKHRKNKNSRNCFQRVFVLQVFFIFRKIVIFMMTCTRWFKIFCIFVFGNRHLGIRIDAKTVFTFCFFCECLWKTNARWWKKLKKSRFSRFYHFFVTRKLLPGHLVLGAKTDFWASSYGIQKSEKSKIL